MPLQAYRGGSSGAASSTLVDQTRAQDFNLVVLQRIDPQIQEIVYSATHVAVYEFDTKGKYWKRSNIEGTLFLVKRQTQPRCQIIVMNGKGTDNFYEVVDGSLETEMLDTFLLYTKGNNQLYGIWFYEDKNCDEFAEYLNKIIRGMPKPSRSTASENPGANSAGGLAAGGAGDDDSFWDAKKVHTNQSSSTRGGQLQQQVLSSEAAAAATGENDLMRLFRQAKERGPAVEVSTSSSPQPPTQPVPPQPAAPHAQVQANGNPTPTPSPQTQAQYPPGQPAPPQAAPVLPQVLPVQSNVQPAAVNTAPTVQASPQPNPVVAAATAMEKAGGYPAITQLSLNPHNVPPSSSLARPAAGLNPPAIPEASSTIPARAISPSPASHASVPGPYPLPPEFFKSSKENGTHVPQTASSQIAARVMSPDPNLLPLPSMPSLVSDPSSMFTTNVIPTAQGAQQAATAHVSPQYENLNSGDQSRDPNGLARFFPVPGAEVSGQTKNNPVAQANDASRAKFRQAVNILMQDDDLVDRVIAGFKRAGLDFC